MKRVFISILACLLLSMGSSYFFSNLEPNETVLQNLYTILGIMFSIGLSLAITFNLSGVKNKIIKNRIRENINNVRNNFIIFFGIISLCYISYDMYKQMKFCIKDWCLMKFSHMVILLMIYTISYYIYNFLQLQKLNIKIEDLLD